MKVCVVFLNPANQIQGQYRELRQDGIPTHPSQLITH